MFRSFQTNCVFNYCVHGLLIYSTQCVTAEKAEKIASQAIVPEGKTSMDPCGRKTSMDPCGRKISMDPCCRVWTPVVEKQV